MFDWSFRRWAITLSIAIVLVTSLFGGAWMLMGSKVVSKGEKTGFIIKFTEHQGWVWNTWEGEMALGGSKEAQANVWAFSVVDKEVIPKVQAAQRKARPVTLHYKQQYSTQKWKGDTSYFVDDVLTQEN